MCTGHVTRRASAGVLPPAATWPAERLCEIPWIFAEAEVLRLIPLRRDALRPIRATRRTLREQADCLLRKELAGEGFALRFDAFGRCR
jgi:hypothetical protein